MDSNLPVMVIPITGRFVGGSFYRNGWIEEWFVMKAASRTHWPIVLARFKHVRGRHSQIFTTKYANKKLVLEILLNVKTWTRIKQQY